MYIGKKFLIGSIIVLMHFLCEASFLWFWFPIISIVYDAPCTYYAVCGNRYNPTKKT